jgi:ABC-type branched-subunit amino acid transport system substrate-binding protein
MSSKRRLSTLAVAAATAAALALTACGSSKSDDGGDSGGTGGDGDSDAGGLVTGPGVSDDTITIGALTDMTGPYATLGKSVTQGQQLLVEEVNAAGGVCERQLELVVRDHEYDAGKATSSYAELEADVIGFSQFIGSPYVTGAKTEIDTNQTVVIAQAWTASLLGSKYIHMIGATYDVETINAVDFLISEQGLAEGDKIGHVYFEGDYGENALQGAEYAAEQSGMTVVGQSIKPTDQDMTAQVTSLAREGVSAIIVSAGPLQAASVAGVAAAAGLDVPIIGNNSAFAPQLLGSEAAPALLNNFYIASPGLPIGSDEPGPSALAAAYAEAYPEDSLDNGIVAGYGAMELFIEGLKAGCEAEDLSREGLADALAGLSSFNNGFGIEHDFSDPSAPSSLESFILKPNAEIPGGLAVEVPGMVSDMVSGFSRG